MHNLYLYLVFNIIRVRKSNVITNTMEKAKLKLVTLLSFFLNKIIQVVHTQFEFGSHNW